MHRMRGSRSSRVIFPRVDQRNTQPDGPDAQRGTSPRSLRIRDALSVEAAQRRRAKLQARQKNRHQPVGILQTLCKKSGWRVAFTTHNVAPDGNGKSYVEGKILGGIETKDFPFFTHEMLDDGTSAFEEAKNQCAGKALEWLAQTSTGMKILARNEEGKLVISTGKYKKHEAEKKRARAAEVQGEGEEVEEVEEDDFMMDDDEEMVGLREKVHGMGMREEL